MAQVYMNGVLSETRPHSWRFVSLVRQPLHLCGAPRSLMVAVKIILLFAETRFWPIHSYQVVVYLHQSHLTFAKDQILLNPPAMIMQTKKDT